MANKAKEKIKNNLLKIREDKKYTQKEMAELLNVSERQVCNYEIGETNLPIDKAMIISEKWNYSLDWIYCNTDLPKENRFFYNDFEHKNFLVNIRDFFHIRENNILFSIPDNFLQYIKDVQKIRVSYDSSVEKDKMIAQLNGTYNPQNESGVFWEYSIPLTEFISRIHIGKYSSTYVSNEYMEYDKPTNEQYQEFESFLKEVLQEN